MTTKPHLPPTYNVFETETESLRTKTYRIMQLDLKYE